MHFEGFSVCLPQTILVSILDIYLKALLLHKTEQEILSDFQISSI